MAVTQHNLDIDGLIVETALEISQNVGWNNAVSIVIFSRTLSEISQQPDSVCFSSLRLWTSVRIVVKT